MIFDSDDFGCNHEISAQCQSHDCRDILLALRDINPKFKATLFAIPGEMTRELLDWARDNSDWIELALHGFFHSSNWECEKLGYGDIEDLTLDFEDMIEDYFVKGFKAPGWQISDHMYEWLADNGWWVADQSYNDHRRRPDLPVYKIDDHEGAVHTHTWNCVGNGVYELFDELAEKVKNETEFFFVSEVVK